MRKIHWTTLHCHLSGRESKLNPSTTRARSVVGFLKKIFFLVGAAAVVVVGIRLQQAHNQALQVPTPQEIQAPSPMAFQQRPAPLLRPDPVEPPESAIRRVTQFDPLSQRQLDLAIPKSKRQLLSGLSEFKEPILPGTKTEDADVKAVFRGYYEAEPGKFRRIELNRAQNIYLSVEDLNHRFPVYQEAKGDFDVSNFEDDPYSLVMTLRDLRVIYLKFYTGRKIPDYSDPQFRVMSGWILDAKAPRQARRVALIDGRKPELADTRDSSQYVWPRLEVMQMLMPNRELGD